MKITTVQATFHLVPAPLPLEPPGHAPIGVVFVRVETDEGLTGTALAPSGSRELRDFINRQMGPLLTGQDPLATERVWRELAQGCAPVVKEGAIPARVLSAGLSSVDIALWDIKGKACGLPVYRLLGGFTSTPTIYITFGFVQYSREALVEVARSLTEQGYDKLLMMMGVEDAQNVAEDAERVRVVREAVGGGVRLMVDGNHRFDYARAQELARRVEPYEILWFEEPVAANDIADLKRLRQASSIPIAAGQLEASKERQCQLVAEQAVDFLHANVYSVGGYTEGLKVAHLAQTYGVPFAGAGGWPHHLHLVAGVGGWGLEVHFRTMRLAEAVLHGIPRPEGGKLTLPERPGVGFEPNEAALKEFLAD